jgi:hypothetical protein
MNIVRRFGVAIHALWRVERQVQRGRRKRRESEAEIRPQTFEVQLIFDKSNDSDIHTVLPIVVFQRGLDDEPTSRLILKFVPDSRNGPADFLTPESVHNQE